MIEFGKPKKAKCLEVKIGDNVHNIPIAANLPLPFAKRLRAINDSDKASKDSEATSFFMEYFGAYLGSDLDLLDMEDFGTLITAWNEMSVEGGASVGESQASPR